MRTASTNDALQPEAEARRAQMGPARVAVVCWGIIACCAALWLVMVWSWNGRSTWLGTTLGGDYPAFHVAGRLVATGQTRDLYNLSVQARLYHELLPHEPADASLPFALAPVIALVMAPLSSLGYTASYAVWCALSAGAHVLGVWLTLRHCTQLDGRAKRMALLVACAFEPFIIETIHGGQLSAIAILFIGVGIHLHNKGAEPLSGIMLGLLAFKPTLLALIVPAALAMGQWRVLAGMCMGGGAVLGLSAIAAGPEVLMDWLRLLIAYPRLAAGEGAVFRTWKYVDINSFCMLLGIGRAGVPLAIAGGAAFVGALAWNRLRSTRPIDWPTGLAMALMLTPAVNVYVGIYDGCLIVPGLLLLARPSDAAQRWWMAALFVVPWFACHLARATGVQIYTAVLLASGWCFARRTGAIRAGAGTDRNVCATGRIEG